MTNGIGIPIGIPNPTPASRGGTGLATLTANSVMIGNGISAVQFVAPSNVGNVLRSNGTAWSSSAIQVADLPDGIGSYTISAQAVATTNVNIAASGATADGYTLVSGDRMLLTGQTTGSQNGLWIFNGASSPLTRPTDYASGQTKESFFGLTVFVVNGTVNNGSLWRMTTTGAITIDTTATTWTQMTVGVSSGGSGANLSGTGGPNQFVKQSTAGGAFSVGTIGTSDLPSLTGLYVRIAPASSTDNVIIPTGDFQQLVSKDSGATQTSNRTEWQNSSGTVLFQIGPSTVVSAASATLRDLYVAAQTITITGSTNITTATGFNLVEVGQPTYSAASALTITNAATLYIAGAPVGAGAGPATITNAYALWVNGGITRLDGNLILNQIIAPLTDSTSALKITKADQSTAILTIDSTNGNVAFGGSASNSAYALYTAIGYTQPTTTQITIHSNPTVTQNANSSLAPMAEAGRFDVRLNQAGFNQTTNGGAIKGLYSRVRITGASGTVARIIGEQIDVINGGAGTLGTGIGLQISNVNNNGGGTFTNFIGSWVADVASGTITNWTYYLAGGSTGNPAGNYAFYDQTTFASSFLGSATVASAANAVWNGIEHRAATATITGSTNITTATGFNYASFAQPTLSAASALTVTNSATVYIANAPTGAGAGPVTITNAYPLWVAAGTARFDGPVTASTLTITGGNYIRPSSDGISPNASLLITKADGSTVMMSFNTVDGRVGILTANPATPFHLLSSQNIGITMEGTNQSTGVSAGQVALRGAAGGYGAGFLMQSKETGTNTLLSQAGIEAEGSGSWNSVATASSFLRFSTANAGTLSERVRIMNTGEVSIGTTSKLAMIAVVGTSDQKQEVIRANGTQTSDLVQWQKSDGTVYTSLSGVGLCNKYNSDTTGGNGLVAIMPRVALTGQTGSISATSIQTPAADGEYMIALVLTKTTAGTSGTVVAQITWTDENGAQTFNSSTLTFGTTGFTDFVKTIHAKTTAAIQYNTTVTAPIGNPAYSLYIDVMRVA